MSMAAALCYGSQGGGAALAFHRQVQDLWVRLLVTLVASAVAGIGLYGVYWFLKYLSMPDATAACRSV